MPKNVVSFQFPTGTNGYVTDLNQNITMNSRFVAPPDIDGIAAAAIVTAAGGIITNETSVCSDSASGTPRKLQFIRANGNSISVAIADRTTLTTAATSIRNVINGASAADNQVVCIKLYGEDFPNLNDELGVNFDGTTFATSHVNASGSKQNFASGVIAYEADAASTFGTSVIHPIRSITEKDANELSAQLGTAGTTCVGGFLNVANCGNGRRNPRKHRRFKLTLAISATESETIEVPAKGAGTLDLLACGNAVAALPGVYCVGYMGESYSRFHKLLA